MLLDSCGAISLLIHAGGPLNTITSPGEGSVKS
jgi:hypothetical protein